jgi:hypothetical protein
VIADLEPPKPLPPILPGYRPPFNSETGRAAGLKSQARIREQRELVKAIPKPFVVTLTPRARANLLAAIRRAFRRHCDASVNPELEDSGLNHAKIARLFFDMEMDLLGHGSKSHKSTKKPHLAGPAPSPLQPSSTPLESGNQSVNPTSALPTSETASVAPVSKPAKSDDTPF